MWYLKLQTLDIRECDIQDSEQSAEFNLIKISLLMWTASLLLFTKICLILGTHQFTLHYWDYDLLGHGTMQFSSKVLVKLYGTRWGCEVSDMSQLLYPRERYGTYWTGGWVGPRGSMDRCGKSHPCRGLIPCVSGPWWALVLTMLSRPTIMCCAISQHSENIITDFRHRIYHRSNSGYDVTLYPRMDTSSTSHQKCKNLHSAKDSARLIF